MVDVSSLGLNEDDHALLQMGLMYEASCASLQSKDDNCNVKHLYDLYDCVALILAHMHQDTNINNRMMKPNSSKLYDETKHIPHDELNRQFLDFDKTYYGKGALTSTMNALKYTPCQQELFWRKLNLHLNPDTSKHKVIRSHSKVITSRSKRIGSHSTSSSDEIEKY
jgi:hypothetical protein